MLEIRKKGLDNWVHLWNGNDFSSSKIFINFREETVRIAEFNAAPIFLKNGFPVADVVVYDDTNGGVSYNFSNTIALNQLLVDLNYIAFDGSGGGTTNPITASNALTKVGDNIKLGGLLTEDTDIGVSTGKAVNIKNPEGNMLFAMDVEGAKLHLTELEIQALPDKIVTNKAYVDWKIGQEARPISDAIDSNVSTTSASSQAVSTLNDKVDALPTPSQTLQEVTDNGATTTNNITILDSGGDGELTLGDAGNRTVIRHSDSSGGLSTVITQGRYFITAESGTGTKRQFIMDGNGVGFSTQVGADNKAFFRNTNLPSQLYYEMPASPSGKVFAVSVNGQYADTAGDITVVSADATTVGVGNVVASTADNLRGVSVQYVSGTASIGLDIYNLPQDNLLEGFDNYYIPTFNSVDSENNKVSIEAILSKGNLVTLAITTGLTVGKAYYLSPTGWIEADATAISTSTGLIAIATSATSVDSMAIKGVVTLNVDAGGAVGDVCYLSTTTGQLSTTPVSATGNINRIIGYKTGTNQIFLNPSQDWIEIS